MTAHAPQIEPPAGEITSAAINDAEMRERRLGLAEWHLREAVVMASLSDDENESYHLQAAREWLAAATGRKIKARDIDGLRFELQKEIDG
jgi:hypothetical protein